MTTIKNSPNSSENTTAVNSIAITARYQADPLALYQVLCENKSNNVLLESAEIDKKHQLKSLLLTDAAVKLVCNNQQVVATALTSNGQPVLLFLAQLLQDVATVSVEENTLTIEFAEVDPSQDENSRILAATPFTVLRQLQQLTNIDGHEFGVFVSGAFAFDMMSVTEKLPQVAEGDNNCPDYVFYLAETLIVIDHEQQTSDIIANIFTGINQQQNKDLLTRRLQTIKALMETEIPRVSANNVQSKDSSVHVDQCDDTYKAIVARLKENIMAGDIFQVVPSRTFSLNCPSPLFAYEKLKQTNPSPYMFYLNDEQFSLFGASPESALKYQASNRQVEIYPIAGTRPRGFDAQHNYSPDLDSRIELALRNDEKEKAEHLMLVDLARNDIARVSKPGTRYVADLLKVDRYSHVMHLVSRVCGTLTEELDALHAYQACMNMGTLSGAPKVRATELIRHVEGKRRGSYGGAVGYITGNGDMDTCIVIRSAFVANGVAHVQAGAGVVYDSNPQAEADETRQKAQAVINAIQLSLAAGAN